MNKKRENNDRQAIEKLLAEFYSGTIEPDELQRLYAYFLHTRPIPAELQEHVPIIRPLAMMHSRMAASNTTTAKPKTQKHYAPYRSTAVAAAAWAVLAMLVLALWPEKSINDALNTPMVGRQTLIAKAAMDEMKHMPLPQSQTSTPENRVPTTHNIIKKQPAAQTPKPREYEHINMPPTHTTNAAICMAEDTETNKTDNIADTALAIPYNNHKEWVIYCNNSCSSLELNNIVATTLNTHTQYNEQI